MEQATHDLSIGMVGVIVVGFVADQDGSLAHTLLGMKQIDVATRARMA